MLSNMFKIAGGFANRYPALKWFFVTSLLPGLIAASWLGFVFFKHEHAQQEQELMRTARALIQSVDREHEKAQAALEALATSDALASGDLAAFYRYAGQYLASYPEDNILVTDLDGNPLLNLKHPFGAELPAVGDSGLIQQVVATRRPAVSGTFQGNVLHRMVVANAVPVFREGKLVYALIMARLPARFDAILAAQRFPASWIGVVIDRRNTIVARTLSPEFYVGKKAAAGVIEALSLSPEGTMRVSTVEGIPTIGAYSRSDLSGWTVAVGIPTDEMYGAVWRSIALLSLGVLALMGAGLGLAWYFGGYVVRSLRQLGAAVHEVTSGQSLQSLPKSGPSEIAQLTDDISRILLARSEVESALRESERLYRSLFDNMRNGFVYGHMMYDGERARDFVFLSVNPAFGILTGLKDVVGKRAGEVLPDVWKGDRELLEIFSRVARTGGQESFDIYVKALGEWFSITVYSPEREHFVMIFDVITQRKEQQAKISRMVRLYAVLSGINSAIVRIHERQALLDAACKVAVDHGQFSMAWMGLVTADGRFVQPMAAAGVSLKAMKNIPLQGGGDATDGPGTIAEALHSRRPVYCNDITIAPMIGPVRSKALESVVLPLVVDGRGIGVMGLYAREAGFFDEEEMRLLDELAADISFALQYIEREERINYLAYYDALTGLPNRTLFLDRLAQFMHGVDRGSHSVAVLLLDLDRFTYVNETYGRSTGDVLLKLVAERLQTAVQEPCSLARIGADSFAVAASNLERGPDAASALRLRIFEAVELPIALDGFEIHVAIHAGIALYPGDGDDAQALLLSAEGALKEAQSAGQPYLYYAPDVNARIAANLTLERELRTALDAGHLVMYFQPRVDLRSGNIVGAEALIRWQHVDRGLVMPSEFIPQAEQTGLIVQIGAWVIDAICAQQAAWLAAGVDIVPVAVNLSPVELAHGHLLRTLEQALARHALDPKYLELELTESVVMQNPDEAAQMMKAFRKCGLRLSLDDFGTGYSSLAYLRRFPFDIVKIDRTFITDITHDPGDAAIATAVIAMSHRLNLKVVAEGVETEGQLRYLRQHDCDQMQGFYFSPPVPAEAFMGLLQNAKSLNLAEPQPDDERNTILIVDDDPRILSALHRVLRREGYRVLKASSGEEGLDLLALNKVQVIISDQRMPGMSGSEFLGIVKELHPDTIRIILSGYTDLQVVTESVNRGAVYKFLTKPWDDDLLKEHVREAFLRYAQDAGQKQQRPASSAEVPEVA